MLKRSSSSSHIPIKMLGYNTGSKEPARRSKSNSRLNEAKQATKNPSSERKRNPSLERKRNPSLERKRNPSLERIRNPSLDRKSNLLSVVKMTPLQRPSGSGYGFNRPTPLSAGSSSRSSRAKLSPGIGLGKKLFSKNFNNANWVGKQHTKVQNFVATHSSLFDLTVVNPNNIKPPTMKGFVCLINVILQQIFENVNITQENYKEELVKCLKLIRYPGSITVSTLKSVNTMHCWPHVIAMCGWLIDKLQLTETGYIDISLLPEEERRRHLLQELFLNNVEESHRLYNFKEEATDEEHRNNYETQFKEILGIDEDTYHAVKASYDQKLKYKNNLEMDVKNVLEENENLKKTLNELEDSLLNQKEKNASQKAEIEVEMVHFKEVYQKLLIKDNELKIKIMRLEESFKTQPCSYQKKMELINKIEDLKNEIKVVRGKFDHAYNIKQKFDVKLNEEREKLQSKVIEWNRNLMEVCIKKPSLKKLLLEEKGFHSDKYLEKCRKVFNLTQQVEKELTKSIEETEDVIKQLKIELQQLQMELETENNIMDEIMVKCEKLSGEKAILDTNIKQALTDWDIKKNSLLAKKNSSDDDLIKSFDEENATLMQENEKLIVKVNEFGRNAIKFFAELNILIDNTVKEMNVIMIAKQMQIEDYIEKKLKEKKELLEVLKHFVQ